MNIFLWISVSSDFLEIQQVTFSNKLAFKIKESAFSQETQTYSISSFNKMQGRSIGTNVWYQF